MTRSAPDDGSLAPAAVDDRHETPSGLADAPVQPGAVAERQPGLADEQQAALADALAAVGDRWTLLLVAALLEGPRRFGDLQDAVPGIAPNVLTQRLRQLERNALVIARPYSERPPRFVYELTAAGQELAGVLRLLAGWGARNSEAAATPRHHVCGTPMEARWWCPTCEQAVDDGEAEDLHFA
jgi:DNA-binding HxlR family transcriptional regulator